MKKRYKVSICLLISFLFLFGFCLNAKASVLSGVTTISDCPLLGDSNSVSDPAYWILWAFKIIKYIGIIALLALVIMDFFTAMVQNDKDAIKKAGVKALKRFVYCVLLFFIPMMVDLLLKLFGIAGGCELEGVTMLWLKRFGI